MFKIGDEVYVDTSIPNGWSPSIYNSGIREATVIETRVWGMGFIVNGVECHPHSPKGLIVGRIVRQLEND